MDENDNRLVDFSYAGYKNGGEEIPQVESIVSIGPIEGDNTSHLQAVIDSVSKLAPNEDGIIGAIYLEAGTYEIHGTLQILTSGVIIRGAGDGEDPQSNSILVGVGNNPNQRNIIEAGGLQKADWTSREANSTSPISSPFVPAGSRTLQVGIAEYYSEGDEVVIRHLSTSEWLESIDYGATDSDAPWSAGDIDIFYKRTITAVNLVNGKVTLDVPIYDHFEKDLATAELYKLDETDIKTKIGIEDLRIVISTAGSLTEDHAKNAIFLRGIEDSWVSNVTGFHFSYAMVDMTVASRVSVRNCKGLQPHSLIEGARRYNFAVGSKCNNILFTACMASEGRHSFVSNGTSSVSGIVWHDSQSIGDYSTSEGHRRWSQALLFDNIEFTEPNSTKLLGLYNRGSFGTGHGWSSTQSVAWNVRMPSGNTSIIQAPPGRQNYAIACQGTITNQHSFTHPLGYVEDSGAEPVISSLYEAQLSYRLSNGDAIDPPARFSVEVNGDSVQISWLDIADNEAAYIVETSMDGVNFTLLAQVAENETELSLPVSQLPGGKAYFRMYASSTSCPSAFTHTRSLDLPSSIENLDPFELIIFPNPVSDYLTIETKTNRIERVEVFSLDGTPMELPFSNKQLNTRQLHKGIYFIRVRLQGGETAIEKLIRN